MLLRIEVFGDDIYLDDATTLGDELVTDLDPGLEERLDHLLDVDAQQVGDLLGDCVVRKNGLNKKDGSVSFIRSDSK